MKKLLILALLTASLLGCNQRTNTKTEQQQAQERSEATHEKPTAFLELGCYSYTDDLNSVILQISNLEDSIVGKLTYTHDGKDINSGVFIGELNDNKLFGTYTFISEGKESKRKIAFLIKDEQLIEGYAELNENGTGFLDKENITYASATPLTKTDCD